MRAIRLVARGLRNLADLDLDLPDAGGVFLGPNGHGKTSLLEALYYPVLFRSVRGASDTEVTGWHGSGFHVAVTLEGAEAHEVSARFSRATRRRRVWIDGTELTRLSEAVGQWLAVAFLPTDLQLVQGPAAERRGYLDRVLSLADPAYLRALVRYRGALSQRNAALRQGRPDLASVFDVSLAGPGAAVVSARMAWVAETGARFQEESALLGEPASTGLRYRTDESLAEEAAWPAALAAARSREAVRGQTMVGPHRDDLVVTLDDRGLREFGSTGQQRTAAVALKLCELATLAERRGTEPALLLDDVFAELDATRQAGLAARLGGGRRQVFVTAPRRDELPEVLELPVFEVREGRVSAWVGA